ncbi:protein-tyrosine phosphatase-like protein [Zopfochytrium polystomum]|nr:protein-tyrosine phosphatase-like protein [Zopfochytrium polystomum]
MDEIIPNLFVSDLATASDTAALRTTGITHILSIDPSFAPSPAAAGQHSAPDGFVRLALPVLDVPAADLLSHLDAAVAFCLAGGAGDEDDTGRGGQATEKAAASVADGDADAAAAGTSAKPSPPPPEPPAPARGKVLVHCVHGVSRSAAVAAACVMRVSGASARDAVERVRAVRPKARPNDGFIEQLELYEAMGCRVDAENQKYRVWLLERLAQEVQEHSTHRSYHARRDPIELIAAGRINEPSMRCKKCRRVLALSSHILAHAPGTAASHASFSKRYVSASAIAPVSSSCSSHFVEPVAWMVQRTKSGDNGILPGRGESGAGAAGEGEGDLAEFAAMEGRLACPKCDAKLGAFNWAGSPCSCGVWVAPAFALHKTKLDSF